MRQTSWQPVGEFAVRVQVASLAQAHRVWAALRAAELTGVRDLVVGADSVLVVGDPAGCDFAAVRSVAEQAEAVPAAPPRRVEIAVTYAGADLDEVARRTNLSTVEVVRRHTAADYVVAFIGFAPGFGYLTGLDPALRLPRRDRPRTRVPAGSVAIAGDYTAVYPAAVPGGWHLLGHTDRPVFDPADAARPALLAPGDRVRFVAR